VVSRWCIRVDDLVAVLLARPILPAGVLLHLPFAVDAQRGGRKSAQTREAHAKNQRGTLPGEGAFEGGGVLGGGEVPVPPGTFPPPLPPFGNTPGPLVL
jgi:hypothetical protein